MSKRARGGIVGLMVMLVAGSVLAQDEEASAAEKKVWSDQAEFSYVATDGNSKSSTLGFKNLLTGQWERSSVEVKAGAIQAQSTNVVDRFAVGSPGSFQEVVIEQDETTAENYYLNGRYDQKITERFFWYAGAGWDRNRPAGIDNRYVASGGVGNIWSDTEKTKFRTDYAASYTRQEDVVQVPGIDETYPGLRFSWAYKHRFGESTDYVNDFVFDLNLDDTEDWRGDMINSVAVAMNSRVALKVSLQWLYRNRPSFDEVALFDTVGGTQLGTVFVEKEELDTLFTASVVVNF